MANASKYRIKKKKNTSHRAVKSASGVPKEPPLIGKGKILLMLFFGTAAVSGIYIAAMIAVIKPVFYAYWILTTVMLCAYVFLRMKDGYRYAKLTANGTPSEKERELMRKRIKRQKYFLIIMLPFIFTLIGDTVYLLFLKDLHIIDAVKSLL